MILDDVTVASRRGHLVPVKVLVVRVLASGAAGVLAVLAATGIAAITGSESISPLAAIAIGGAIGLSAGAAIGRPERGAGRLLQPVLQAVIAAVFAALTTLLLHR